MSVNQIQSNWPLQKPRQLVYVELGPNNGGMVLGICEQGLSFRAVAPLKTEGPIHFTFALDGKTKLYGAGEIAWADDGGKSGGLKFTNVSPQFRESLRDWLASGLTPKTVGREVTPAAALPLDSISQHQSTSVRAEVPEPKPSAAPLPAIPQAIASPRAAIPAQAPPELKPEREPVEVVRPAEPQGIEVASPPVPTPSSQPEQKPVPAEPGQVRPSETQQRAYAACEPEPEVRTAATLPETKPPVDSGFSLPNFRLPSATVVPTPGELVAPQPRPKAATPERPEIAVDPPVPTAPLHSVHLEPLPVDRRLIPPPAHDPVFAEAHQAPAGWTLEPEPESPRLNRAAAAGIISLALAVLLVALVLSFRREVGEMLIRVGQSLSGEEWKPATAQPPVSSNTPAQNASSAIAPNEKADERSVVPPVSAGSADANSATTNSTLPNSTNSDSVAANSPSANPVQSAQDSPKPAGSSAGGTGQKEFEQARAMLRGSHRQRDLPLVVDLLTTATLKGYVPAEVTLADLYARGDGVKRNCAQARILLQAAVQKGSPEARRRLDQLKRQGCS